MYNHIVTHRQFMTKKLHDTSLRQQDYARLYAYHLDRVRDFQHERLVHLLVTFFFAFLTVVTLAAVLLLQLPEVLPYLLMLLAIFFALDAAYIWHYYHLENGVQSLYGVTEELSVKAGMR